MKRFSRLARILLPAACGGMAFQIAGCGGPVVGFVRNLNPCGTVLNCDPTEYRFLTSGYQGPGFDPNVDPSCTFPPFCPNDPFVSSQTTP